MRCKTEALEARFAEASAEAGFYNLKGHPLFGGLRVTVYNQLPDDAVDASASSCEFQMKEEVATRDPGAVESKEPYASSPPSVLAMMDARA